MIDPVNGLTHTSLIAASNQSDNTASAGVDISTYIGRLAVDVQIGAKSAGTTPSITVQLAASADTNVSNATNISGAITTAPSNAGVAGLQTLGVDTRAVGKYLFALPIVTGTNTPAFPLSATIIGQKQVQP